MIGTRCVRYTHNCIFLLFSQETVQEAVGTFPIDEETIHIRTAIQPTPGVDQLTLKKKDLMLIIHAVERFRPSTSYLLEITSNSRLTPFHVSTH